MRMVLCLASSPRHSAAIWLDRMGRQYAIIFSCGSFQRVAGEAPVICQVTITQCLTQFQKATVHHIDKYIYFLPSMKKNKAAVKLKAAFGLVTYFEPMEVLIKGTSQDRNLEVAICF